MLERMIGVIQIRKIQQSSYSNHKVSYLFFLLCIIILHISMDAVIAFVC